MNLSNRSRLAVASILFIVVNLGLVDATHACGPSFPNSMIAGGDGSLLSAPHVDFLTTLQVLPPVRTAFHGQNAPDFIQEAAEADEADLAAALKNSKLDRSQREATLRAFLLQRAKFTDFRIKLKAWRLERSLEARYGQEVPHPPEPQPVRGAIDFTAIPNVPTEFVEYLNGSVAWCDGDRETARTIWEKLMQRPAEERPYRSTWATYMLGKYWQANDADKAISYFQKVRTLKKKGFADRICLAASALGDEAGLELGRTNYLAAMKLFFEQYSAGDSTAGLSLAQTCHCIIEDENAHLTVLARDTVSRRVLTAYFIHGNNPQDCARWLTAVEEAGVTDLAAAEQLALAAYQIGEWRAAARWLHLAPVTATTRWLQAKLWLHEGKIAAAAAQLRELVPLFPATTPFEVGRPETHDLSDAFYFENADGGLDSIAPQRELMGEIGILQLTRSEYEESLDTLLNADFWADAAYVAERVLTVDELKTVVDRSWPADRSTETNVTLQLRYLLARRLARDGQFEAARPYYPADQLTNYDAMAHALETAEGTNASTSERVTAFTEAAFIVRTNGMELLGTELAPDWKLFEGGYSDIYDFHEFRQPTNSSLATITRDEKQRTVTDLQPTLRFHYRYEAAALAREAAQLLPDNTEEKARLLCQAGLWIKVESPEIADVYYKELVRHCRKTAIGTLAERRRWFPDLDVNGNLLPWKPQPPTEIESTNGEIGLWYQLNRGDSVEDVIQLTQSAHRIEITLSQLVAANPELNTNGVVKSGTKIFVPSNNH